MVSNREIMLRQSYTPITGAPVCLNCRYREVRVLENREREYICGLGGFPVQQAGVCELHEPPTADKNRQVPS